MRVLRVIVTLPSPAGSFRPLRFRVVVTLPPPFAESLNGAFRRDRVTRLDCGSVSPPSASRGSVLRDESRVLRLCGGAGGGVAMDIELVRLLRLLLMVLRGDDDAAAVAAAAAARAAAGVGVELVTSFRGSLSRTREGLSMSIDFAPENIYSVHDSGMTMSFPECCCAVRSPARLPIVILTAVGGAQPLFTLRLVAHVSHHHSNPPILHNRGKIKMRRPENGTTTKLRQRGKT